MEYYDNDDHHLDDVLDNNDQENYTPVKRRKKVKSISCDKCEEVFTSRKKLKKHMSEEHDGVGIKDLKCETCGKEFYDNSNLRIHISNAHGLGKRHKCDQCERTFALPCHLRKLLTLRQLPKHKIEFLIKSK